MAVLLKLPRLNSTKDLTTASHSEEYPSKRMHINKTMESPICNPSKRITTNYLYK